MNITISPRVFQGFHPQFRLALIGVHNFNNRAYLKESIHLLKEAEHLIRLSFNKDTIKSHLLISPWAAARSDTGKNARHYTTSVERLLTTVLSGKTVVASDVLTNLIRYLSLKYIVPVGADDLAVIEGDVAFSLATGQEKLNVIQKMKPNTLYYRDSRGALGISLDYWKSSRTALTKESYSALIHIEALPPVTAAQLEKISRELSRLIRAFGGRTKRITLGRTKRTAVIRPS